MLKNFVCFINAITTYYSQLIVLKNAVLFILIRCQWLYINILYRLHTYEQCVYIGQLPKYIR